MKRGRWLESMILKHGSEEAVKQFMSQIGREGGKHQSQSKGFGSMDRVMHKEISAKGGRLSSKKKLDN